MVSEIQPGQTFSRHAPAIQDTMGENKTTAITVISYRVFLWSAFIGFRYTNTTSMNEIHAVLLEYEP